jgi:cytochrome c556
MLRKWMTLAAAMTAVTVVFTGFSLADDQDSPLHKLMERVNAKNLVITKGVRTPVAYKKAQKDVADAATELAKLGKDARKETGPAKAQKKTQTEWEKLMDDYIKKAEGLAEVTGKPSATQVEAKSAHNAVKATCTACHNVFRVDEEK